MSSLRSVSPYIATSKVSYTSGPAPLLVEYDIFPLNASRRRAARRATAVSRCDTGTEWRLTKQGAPDAFACNCPANPQCVGPTPCNITPASGDVWFVRTVPASLCDITLADAGDLAAATALATQPFVPSSASPDIVRAALRAALRGVNLSRPMERSIPFYAARGLILKTVVGVIFPADFAMQVMLQLICSCPKSS